MLRRLRNFFRKSEFSYQVDEDSIARRLFVYIVILGVAITLGVML